MTFKDTWILKTNLIRVNEQKSKEEKYVLVVKVSGRLNNDDSQRERQMKSFDEKLKNPCYTVCSDRSSSESVDEVDCFSICRLFEPVKCSTSSLFTSVLCCISVACSDDVPISKMNKTSHEH